MPNMRTKLSEKCEYEGCRKKAIGFARGRKPEHRNVGSYCENHCEVVAEEDSPEYREMCPNCECMFGVN